MDVCAAYGLATVRVGGRSGVWVSGEPASCGPFSRAGCDERKVCALGVRVARDVTMHGIGLNVDTDLAAFGLDRIVPCGIDDAGVTSLTAETGRRLRPVDVAGAVLASLDRSLTPLVVQDTPTRTT